MIVFVVTLKVTEAKKARRRLYDASGICVPGQKAQKEKAPNHLGLPEEAKGMSRV